MSGVSRPKLTGVPVVIEYRVSCSKFFVTFPSLAVELVMAFDHRETAAEIAVNVHCGTPFYTMIPTVPYRTPYQRPWLQMPPTDGVRESINLVIVQDG
jgi:hypothetical protein